MSLAHGASDSKVHEEDISNVDVPSGERLLVRILFPGRIEDSLWRGIQPTNGSNTTVYGPVHVDPRVEVWLAGDREGFRHDAVDNSFQPRFHARRKARILGLWLCQFWKLSLQR